MKQLLRQRVDNMPEEIVVTSEFDGYAIPIAEIRRLIHAFPRKHHYRLMIRILTETGMRLSEVNKLEVSNVVRGRGTQDGQFFIHWKPGKNQKGYRKVAISPNLVYELDEYLGEKGRTKGRLWDDGITNHNLTTYVNKKVRPLLGGNWLLKCRRKSNEGSQRGVGYLYQLKGIRHTYQCLRFKYYVEKYTSADVASHLTSREMRHSSTGMTSVYLRSLPTLGDAHVDALTTLTQGCEGQCRLFEFAVW